MIHWKLFYYADLEFKFFIFIVEMKTEWIVIENSCAAFIWNKRFVAL